MVRSVLKTRVKQSNPITCVWINCFCLIAFEIIASGTGQPQIVFGVSTAFGTRNNMIDLHRGIDELRWHPTVSALIVRRFLHPLANRSGYRHVSSRARSPRFTASTNASVLRCCPAS
jgi:hypothetical protein